MFKRVGVVGIGFMGGSLSLSLKEVYKDCSIFGVDINPAAIKKGISLGLMDDGSCNVKDLKDFSPEVVVLATPVRTFKSIAESLELTQDVIITDIGSVKGHIVFMMESLLGSRFVGGHPIAGTEKSGVENSIKGLFKGKKTIITPTERTDKEAKERIKELWKSLGSIVEEMDPYLHDYIFGAVSHLPHAVAFALIKALIKLNKGDNDLFKYPGAGFKDFTRIASSDPIMWKDIFLENKENVINAIDVYIESLEELKRTIVKEDVDKIMQYLKEAKENREEMIN
ncbi:MAG: prephenate dehydrogenase [Aquificaceae bacterium]